MERGNGLRVLEAVAKVERSAHFLKCRINCAEIRHGWRILFHPFFAERMRAPRLEAEELKASLPEARFRSHPRVRQRPGRMADRPRPESGRRRTRTIARARAHPPPRPPRKRSRCRPRRATGR